MRPAHLRRLSAARHLVPRVAVVGIPEEGALTEEEVNVSGRGDEGETEEVLANLLRGVDPPVPVLGMRDRSLQAPQRDQVHRDLALDRAPGDDAAEYADVRVWRSLTA
jgi:hypothetical protein